MHGTRHYSDNFVTWAIDQLKAEHNVVDDSINAEQFKSGGLWNTHIEYTNGHRMAYAWQELVHQKCAVTARHNNGRKYPPVETIEQKIERLERENAELRARR